MGNSLPHILLVLGLSGCAVVPTQTRFPNLDLIVIQAEGRDVNKVCRGVGRGLKDDGTPITSETNIAGCWSSKSRTIYLDHYTENITILLHELCHADGTRTSYQCQEAFPPN